ncbi:hypothetical protein [Umezawaea sp. Da 62-37]|uniref:hypothetical protein n=1 Tax=Umezawaea sp. Da 62-37 TaxID=3075927 RepID=UPI0028F729E0|nr:hypothetical protein [Umezawaea sp. Da 62-37]WNV82252.1 hypothetical protein RM788_29040 [Umezawaea sp. Da 62-37]
MSVPELTKAIGATQVQCFDAFGRQRVIRAQTDFTDGRVSLTLPPGEGVAFTPALARELSYLLMASADAIEPPTATGGTVAGLPSARVPGTAAQQPPRDRRAAGSSSPTLRAVRP